MATIWTGDYRRDGVSDFLRIRSESPYCDSCIATFVQLRLADVKKATAKAEFVRAPGQCSACGKWKSIVVLAPVIGHAGEGPKRAPSPEDPPAWLPRALISLQERKCA